MPLPSSVTQVVFDPMLAPSDYKSFLMGHDVGTAIAVHKGSKRSLLVRTNTGITEHDISDITVDTLVDHTDMSTATNAWNDLCRMYPDRIHGCGGTVDGTTPAFDVVFVNPGTSFYVPKNAQVHAVSTRDPTFFDLQAGNVDASSKLVYTTELASYTKRIGAGDIVHTGDPPSNQMLRGKATLHHGIQGFGKTTAISVVAYSHNVLKMWNKDGNTRPMVAVVDTVNKIVYMLNCPVDEATIHDARHQQLALIVPEGNRLRVVAPKRPPRSDATITSGAITANLRETAKELMTEATTIMTREDAAEKKSAAAPTSFDAAPAPPKAVVDADGATNNLYIASNQIAPPFLLKMDRTRTVYFDVGFSAKANPAATTILPLFAPGMVSGPMATMCRPSEYRVPLSVPRFSVVYVGNVKMTHAVANMNTHRLNGLVIITLPPSNEGTLEQQLDKLDAGPARAFCGPCGMIVVEVGTEWYFYEGIRIPGLVDTTPKYGASMFRLQEALPNFVASSPILPWPAAVEVNAQHPEVFFNGSMMSVKDAMSMLKTGDIGTGVDDVLDLIQQLTRILDDASITKFVSTATKKLSQLIETKLKPLKDTVTALCKDGDRAALAKANAELTGTRRVLNKRYVNVLQALKSMSSSKGKSRNTDKAGSAAHEARVAQMKQNVDEISGWNRQQTHKWFGDCENLLMVDFDRPTIEVALGHVHAGTLTSTPNLPMLTLPDDADKRMYDGFTVETLHEIGGPDKTPLSGKNDFLVQLRDGAKFLPIPIDMFIAARKDLSGFSFQGHANHMSVAPFRILMRSMAIELNPELNPSNSQLAYWIMHVILSAAEQLGGAAHPDFADGIAETIRGLLGQVWSVCASTQKILFPAGYGIMYEHGPGMAEIQLPKDEQWSTLLRIVNLLPRTGWALDTAHFNVRMLICKKIWSALFGAFVQEAQKVAKKAIKAEKGSNKKTMAWKQYIAALYPAIITSVRRDASNKIIGLLPEAATLLLEAAPGYNPETKRHAEVTPGTMIAMHVVYRIVPFLREAKKAGRLCDDAHELYTAKTVNLVRAVVYSGIRYSGKVPEEIKYGARAELAKAKSVKKMIEIWDKYIGDDNWINCENPNAAREFVAKVAEANGIVGFKAVDVAVAIETPQVDVPEEEQDPLQMVLALPGSTKIVPLVKKLDTMTIESEKLPVELIGLMHAVGVVNVTQALRDVVRELIIHWQNRDDAIAAGMAVLVPTMIDALPPPPDFLMVDNGAMLE